jgi:6-phosphogluconolactonase
VPDLGKDTIRQFLFDPETGRLTAHGSFPSGKPGRTALGPRYLDFHPTLPVAYVVNELSSEVAVFAFDHGVAEGLMSGRTTGANSGGNVPPPTLRLVQNISTIPMGWPRSRNTCGRITVHRHGDFVLVSNRGHNSVTSFRINPHSSPPGQLTLATITHTHGATPRHFAFDPSGSWLLAANQDTDSLQVFRFDAATGAMDEAGNAYSIPSPNFVCVMDFNQRPAEASRL